MVTDISEGVSIVYQTNVTLSCIAFGSDITVFWTTTANISLPDAVNISAGKNEYESLLTLTNIPLEAMGIYTCNVENPFDDSDSDIVVVNVTGL